MLRRRAPDPIEHRLRRIERRLEDVEDALAATAVPDHLDDLARRVDELAVTTLTHDDLLHVRTELARTAAEITRVRAEVHVELDRLADALADAGDSAPAPYPRRAAG